LAEVERFAAAHAGSRRPLQRFVEVALAADWPHFAAVRRTFRSADYAPESGTLIFNIGGNNYRLVARVDFEEGMLFIERVMTHAEYDREKL